jgi:hypothetical protein
MRGYWATPVATEPRGFQPELMAWFQEPWALVGGILAHVVA